MSRGARVKLTSQRFERDAVILPYDYDYANPFDIGEVWLRQHGYTVVCSGEMPNAYWAAVAEFKPLREA
jgi:hypothetical protein